MNTYRLPQASFEVGASLIAGSAMIAFCIFMLLDGIFEMRRDGVSRYLSNIWCGALAPPRRALRASLSHVFAARVQERV